MKRQRVGSAPWRRPASREPVGFVLPPTRPRRAVAQATHNAYAGKPVVAGRHGDSVVDLLPDRLLVVLLPSSAWQRDGPARPRPGRPGEGGPHSGADGHTGRELHGRA